LRKERLVVSCDKQRSELSKSFLKSSALCELGFTFLAPDV
jgi:hypothetical protein